MKLGIKNMMVALAVIGTCSCDDNLEVFEVTGSSVTKINVLITISSSSNHIFFITLS